MHATAHGGFYRHWRTRHWIHHPGPGTEREGWSPKQGFKPATPEPWSNSLNQIHIGSYDHLKNQYFSTIANNCPVQGTDHHHAIILLVHWVNHLATQLPEMMKSTMLMIMRRRRSTSTHQVKQAVHLWGLWVRHQVSFRRLDSIGPCPFPQNVLASPPSLVARCQMPIVPGDRMTNTYTWIHTACLLFVVVCTWRQNDKCIHMNTHLLFTFCCGLYLKTEWQTHTHEYTSHLCLLLWFVPGDRMANTYTWIHTSCLLSVVVYTQRQHDKHIHMNTHPIFVFCCSLYLETEWQTHTHEHTWIHTSCLLSVVVCTQRQHDKHIHMNTHPIFVFCCGLYLETEWQTHTHEYTPLSSLPISYSLLMST